MTVALIAFGIIALVADGIFVWQIRNAEKRLDDTTKMFEGMVKRMLDGSKEDHVAHDKQVSELLTRIQAPKDASYILPIQEGEAESQHIGLEDDEGYWEQQRKLNGSD